MTTDTNRAEPMKGLQLSIETVIDAADGGKLYQVRCVADHSVFTICLPRKDRLEAVSLRRAFEDALRGVIAAEVEASRLPLAGAATSAVHVCEKKDAACVEILPDKRCFGCPENRTLLAPSDAAVQPVAWIGTEQVTGDAALRWKRLDEGDTPLYTSPLPTAPAGARTGVLNVAVGLLREVVGPLEVSAAIIESEDGGDAIETLIREVKNFVEQFDRRVLRAPRSGKTLEVIRAFHVALHTGMRLSEVLTARLEGRIAVLPKDKTTKAVVKVPLARKGARLLARYAPFTVGPNEASTLFSELCDELLIEGLTFHDSRATALTLLSRRMDVMTLARISRHRDLRILMDTYYRETAEQIAARLPYYG